MFERLKRWLRGGAPDPRREPEAGGIPQAEQPISPLGGDAAGFLVIDVRSEREFQAIAIDAAINLPLPHLESRIRALVADPSTPLALYCASGARSGIACMMLRQLGYANVVNAGGLHAAAAQLRRELRR